MARTDQSIQYSPDEKFSLKDHLFNKSKIEKIAGEIQAVYPSFDKKDFIAQTVQAFPDLELKQRIAHIVDCLYTFLPQEYPQALQVIVQALPEPLDPNKTDDDFGDFIYEPYNTYISRYGCARQYLEISLDALEQTTQRFSAEFAIREFIKQFPDESLAKMVVWSVHPNYHVRRLASEGTRPNLPWGGKIDIANTLRTQILDNLYHDPTRYVARSVANHINDVSKTDLDWVLDTLKKWRQEGKQDAGEFEWMTKHALRTAVKSGDARAFGLLGYDPKTMYVVGNFQYREEVILGEHQEFSFDFTAEKSGKFMIDYVIYFLKKDGSHTTKTFKIKDAKLGKASLVSISKKHLLRVMSTKKLYPGTHYIALQINGRELEKYAFDLVA